MKIIRNRVIRDDNNNKTNKNNWNNEPIEFLSALCNCWFISLGRNRINEQKVNDTICVFVCNRSKKKVKDRCFLLFHFCLVILVTYLFALWEIECFSLCCIKGWFWMKYPHSIKIEVNIVNMRWKSGIFNKKQIFFITLYQKNVFVSRRNGTNTVKWDIAVFQSYCFIWSPHNNASNQIVTFVIDCLEYFWILFLLIEGEAEGKSLLLRGMETERGWR